MITLSKKLYVIFISSTLFFGIDAMKCNDDDNIDSSEIKIKKELFEYFPDIDKVSGSELLGLFINKLLSEDNLEDFMLNDDNLRNMPVTLETIKPIYQKLPPASKKFLAEIINAAIAVINQKMTKSKDESEKKKLKKIITDAKPIIEFIKNNSDAGMVAQFSLLDLSGKLILGISLPLALYGGYKAAQAIIHKDESLEELQ